jgi:predicted aldo/keto reductase-like oxidoreductase
MKTLAAGKLLSAEHTPFARPLTVAQCIHTALTRPSVVGALVGGATREEVLEAVAYLGKSDAERDYSAVLRDFQGDFKGHCVYCNHCLPCPAYIDIAQVNKYLDLALATQEISATVNAHYQALPTGAGDCTDCGQCEKRCPFAVPVRQRMREAVRVFGDGKAD